jgi:hypothetical protein
LSQYWYPPTVHALIFISGRNCSIGVLSAPRRLTWLAGALGLAGQAAAGGGGVYLLVFVGKRSEAVTPEKRAIKLQFLWLSEALSIHIKRFVNSCISSSDIGVLCNSFTIHNPLCLIFSFGE